MNKVHKTRNSDVKVRHNLNNVIIDKIDIHVEISM